MGVARCQRGVWYGPPEKKETERKKWEQKEEWGVERKGVKVEKVDREKLPWNE